MLTHLITLTGAMLLLAATVDARQTRTLTAATVTNSSSQMLAASTGPRTFLSVSNESATATIACRPDGGTAALNTAGSYTIAAGTVVVWGPTDPEYPVPGGAVNCISNAASSPATIESTP